MRVTQKTAPTMHGILGTIVDCFQDYELNEISKPQVPNSELNLQTYRELSNALAVDSITLMSQANIVKSRRVLSVMQCKHG
jgi:hypothetical protein